MRPKNFALIAMVVAIIGGCVWWFTRSTTAIPVKAAEVSAPTPAKVDATKPAPAQIAARVAPAAPKPDTAPVAATQPIAAPPPDPNADPHDNLNTALTDMARLMRAGDLGVLEETYDSPVELAKIDPQQLQKRLAMYAAMAKHPNPLSQQTSEALAQGLESIEDQTPTYNATGDEATYTFTVTTPMLPGIPVEAQAPQPHTLVMVRINGKWYAKSGL